MEDTFFSNITVKKLYPDLMKVLKDKNIEVTEYNAVFEKTFIEILQELYNDFIFSTKLIKRKLTSNLDLKASFDFNLWISFKYQKYCFFIHIFELSKFEDITAYYSLYNKADNHFWTYFSTYLINPIQHWFNNEFKYESDLKRYKEANASVSL